MTNRMPRPLISVVLPVFNAQKTIGAALASVLSQAFDDMEVLVIDDGSTDSTPELLAGQASQDRRVTIIRTPNRGATAALNTGLAQARGDLIARMDADDICEPSRFEKQASHLGDHPECTAVGCCVTTIDDIGGPCPKQPRLATGFRLKDRCNGFRHFPPSPPTIYHPTAMIRAAALNEVGGYRPYFRSAQDRDLWWRLSRKGEIQCLPERLLRYRIHKEAVSSRHRDRSFADALIADLSAIATHFALDDAGILAEYGSSRLPSAAIERYANLVGPRYPIDRLAAYRAVSRGFPSVAGVDSRARALRYALAQLLCDPTSKAGYRIAHVALTRWPSSSTRKTPELCHENTTAGGKNQT